MNKLYNIRINERQRELIHDLLAEFEDKIDDGQDVPFTGSEIKELLVLKEMLNPQGSIRPLVPIPGINVLVP
jgi:hypothetical protein